MDFSFLGIQTEMNMPDEETTYFLYLHGSQLILPSFSSDELIL